MKSNNVLLQYSIRSLYRDLLASCEEEKEAVTRNPEPSATDEDKQLEKEIESKMEDLTSIPTFPGKLVMHSIAYS